ncbi:MAG: ATP-binding protein [Roseobacter sp.]
MDTTDMQDEADMPVDWIVSRIADYIDDAVLITEANPIDAPGPRVVWCNAAFTQMSGYTRAEICGHSPRILQGHDTDRAALDTIRTALEAWEKVRVEIKNYRKDGTPFWVDLLIQPVADEAGVHRYFVAVQREMPNRDAETDLLRYVSHVTEEAPIALGLVDGDGQLVFANEYFKRLIYDAETPPATPCSYKDWLERGLSGQSGIGAKDDHESWVRRHLSGLFTEPARIEQQMNGHWHEFRRLGTLNDYQLILGEDIEKRIALQDQIRQMTKIDAMGQLTSGVAHDFNNILAVILGNVELLQLAVSSPTDRETFIRETIGAALRGRSLTQSLLAFGRKSKFALDTIKVDALVRDTAEMFRRTSASGLDVHVDCAEGLPDVNIDAGLLQNAFLNLLINARDAMPSGGAVKVQVRIDSNVTLPDLHRGGNATQAISISVHDHGSGMSPNVVKRAIEPFFSTKKVGSGLGLSTVHGFVEQSGGKLDIQSVPGQGTTVTILIPAQSAGPQEDPDDMARQTSLQYCRVLLVEDEPAVKRMLSRILEDAGATVIAFSTGDAAQLADHFWHEADILITDILMPGTIQGDTLARSFMSTHPHKTALLLSGNPDAANAIVARQDSIELMMKPVERLEFLSRVRTLIDRSNQGQPRD